MEEQLPWWWIVLFVVLAVLIACLIICLACWKKRRLSRHSRSSESSQGADVSWELDYRSDVDPTAPAPATPKRSNAPTPLAPLLPVAVTPPAVTVGDEHQRPRWVPPASPYEGEEGEPQLLAALARGASEASCSSDDRDVAATRSSMRGTPRSATARTETPRHIGWAEQDGRSNGGPREGKAPETRPAPIASPYGAPPPSLAESFKGPVAAIAASPTKIMRGHSVAAMGSVGRAATPPTNGTPLSPAPGMSLSLSAMADGQDGALPAPSIDVGLGTRTSSPPVNSVLAPNSLTSGLSVDVALSPSEGVFQEVAQPEPTSFGSADTGGAMSEGIGSAGGSIGGQVGGGAGGLGSGGSSSGLAGGAGGGNPRPTTPGSRPPPKRPLQEEPPSRALPPFNGYNPADLVDKALLYCAGQHPFNIDITKVPGARGVYHINGHRCQVKVVERSLLIRSGGGWVPFKEFLAEYKKKYHDSTTILERMTKIF